MIEQIDGESRLEYLARVLWIFMDNTVAGEQTIEFDGTECDGQCLANDFCSELDLDTEKF